MSNFWRAIALLGAVLFIIILFGMVQKSNDTQDQVTRDSEQRVFSDVTEATFRTTEGDFVVSLNHEDTPSTSTNFIKLAKEGFYDGQRFHRVIEGFMIQSGDPQSKDLAKKVMWGTGGPGYAFADEFNPNLSNVVGTISMANSGPNTNGSQFFINTNDNTFLDGKHSVFGKVISGMDVVTRISKVKKDGQDKPLMDVIINSVELN